MIICLTGCIVLFILGRTGLDNNSWRNETTPLPQETVADLCKSEEPIYADEFYPMIIAMLPEGKATFNDLASVIGKYQSFIEPTFTNEAGEFIFGLVRSAQDSWERHGKINAGSTFGNGFKPFAG